MADNTTLNPGTGGDTISTDDLGGGVKVQRVKVQVGADGAAADVHSGNPLPVSAASLPLPTGAATDRPTAAAPSAARLSDGSAFYDAAKTGQLPAALTGAGNVKTAILEALPAGANNIGDVDVLTLPSLPTGSATIGAVRLVDAADVAMSVTRGAAIPAGTDGLIAVGEDAGGIARALDVRVDSLDGKRRLQIEGKFTLSPPEPPPATTKVSITFAGSLAITTTVTDNYTIANGKRFVVQQVIAGCEGDTSERGSCVEVFYFDGTTEHLIERVYLNGFTTEVYPQTDKARNGTLTDGNGSTKTIRVKRRRLSRSSQEVDFVVRGYEYTP